MATSGAPKAPNGGQRSHQPNKSDLRKAPSANGGSFTSRVPGKGVSGGSFVSRVTKNPKANGAGSKRLTLEQAWTLARRLFVLVAAVAYIVTSVRASVDTLKLLQDTDTSSMDFLLYESKLIAQYAGKTTIRESPMVAALSFDTTPRAKGSLFLEQNSTHLSGCITYAESSIYQDAFQRAMFASIRATLAYNLTFLNPATTEMIMPVIDCTFTSLTTGDITAPRFFYLMRMVSDPEDVYIFAVTMGVQEYQVSKQKASGPSAVTTMTFINDMRVTEIKHYFALALGYPFQAASFQVYYYYGLTPNGFWLLKSVPQNPLVEASKVLSTSCPTGYYVSSPNEQANIVYLIWRLHQDPHKMLADWNWIGKSTVRDSWGWVHYLHLYFATSATVGLIVLLAVMYYNWRSGKIWVGDAFVDISSSHWIRSGLVLLSWYMDGFWALMEFTLYSGNELAKTRTTFIYPSVMRADLMALYVTLVSLIGELFKERIDPALTLALFYIGFEARLEITTLFPGMEKTLIDYADREFMLGIMPLDPSLPEISPLRVWNSKPLPPANAAIVFSAMFPIFCTLVFIALYVASRKTYRRLFPDLIAKQRSSANSAKESDSTRSRLTQFEFA
ncbi:hypothetical protein Gpo141_00012779, partial [Globisporangium polare]